MVKPRWFLKKRRRRSDRDPLKPPRSKGYVFLASFVLVGLIGVLDYLSGYEISFSIFFLIPITFGSWFVGRRFGLALSVLSAVTWYAVDIASGHTYSHQWIPAWNTMVRFGFFVITCTMVCNIRKFLELKVVMADTDSLTGALNPRGFAKEFQKRLSPASPGSLPGALVYLDLDNFKEINDLRGHSEGDRVLVAVAQTLRRTVRSDDVVGRLGGDEFALFLSGTDPAGAAVVGSRVQESLRGTVQKGGWPVSFSIGVVTFLTPPGTVDEALHLADEVMYKVKRGGKDGMVLESLGEGGAA